MSVFKVTGFYSLGVYGWTETFYMDKADAATAYTSYAQNSVFRSPMKADGVRWIGVRVSEEGGVRRGLVYHFPGNPGGQTNRPDLAKVAALVQFQGDDGAKRNMWLRGLRDSSTIFGYDGGSLPSAQLSQQFTDWKNDIVAEGWLIKRLLSIDSNPWNLVTLAEESGVQSNYTQLTCQDALGFTEGDRVYFSGVNRCLFPQLTGQFTVLSVTGNTFIIQAKWWNKASSLQPLEMRCRAADYEYLGITNGNIARFTARDTGRPIGLSRGRRSARSCRK